MSLFCLRLTITCTQNSSVDIYIRPSKVSLNCLIKVVFIPSLSRSVESARVDVSRMPFLACCPSKNFRSINQTPCEFTEQLGSIEMDLQQSYIFKFWTNLKMFCHYQTPDADVVNYILDLFLCSRFGLYSFHRLYTSRTFTKKYCVVL